MKTASISKDKKAQRNLLIKRMKGARHGRVLPTHRLLATMDPEFAEAYEDLFELLMTKDRMLSVKTKELLVIGILATKAEYDALDTHIQRALRIGITSREILEVLEVGMMYGGTESMIFGAQHLARFARERRRD